jgi:Flp pilus assembly protein TadG
MRISRAATLAGCERGAAAAEFAVLFPVLVSTLLGIIWASLLAYSAASLHYAVEGAARCYSVESQCGSATMAQSYAQSRYYGVNVPTFTASTPSCGHQVSATVNVAFSLVLASWKVPLSATACFP